MKATLNVLFLIAMILNINFSYSNPSSENPIKNKLEGVMNAACSTKNFSGAVLIAFDRKIIFENVCGLANRSFEVNNNIETKFNLGSVGKLFTSIAIAQLVQKNKISLSSPVYQIIPGWLPNDEQSKKITVGQLLTHSSGLGNFMDDKRWKLGADSGLYIKIKDYKPLIHDDKLLFIPGTHQLYSNNGYIVLGAIIEAVTHISYREYLEKNIFKPADMRDTGIWSLDEVVPNRSEGYFKICVNTKCHWKNNNYEAPFIGSPAGGAYSTIIDMLKFSEILHRNILVSPELTKEILSTHIIPASHDIEIKKYKIDGLRIPEDFSHYGFAGAWNKYGFAVWENPLLLGHTGGIQGASAFFANSPGNKYTIIILSNMSGSEPIRLYMNIRRILGFSTTIINY